MQRGECGPHTDWVGCRYDERSTHLTRFVSNPPASIALPDSTKVPQRTGPSCRNWLRKLLLVPTSYTRTPCTTHPQRRRLSARLGSVAANDEVLVAAHAPRPNWWRAATARAVRNSGSTRRRWNRVEPRPPTRLATTCRPHESDFIAGGSACTRPILWSRFDETTQGTLRLTGNAGGAC